MNRYWAHFKTIIKHKIEVGKICFKFKLYKQGLLHDLSKFSLTEFMPSAKYFQGTVSPIDKEKMEKGYSNAWLHHKARNKHHQWYWMDWDNDQNPVPCRIPRKYVYEMVADWIGAGKVYGNNAGKEWSWSEPYEYYKKYLRESKSDYPIWNYETRAMIDTILVHLKEYGIDYISDKVKRDYYGYCFYDSKKGVNGKYPWEEFYDQLLDDYYN